MYAHLLVALDGSDAAERVLEHALAIATAFRARLTLLRASMSAETVLAQTASGGPAVADVTAPVDPEPIVEAERAEAADYTEGVAARLRQAGLEVDIDLPAGRAEEMIVERAAALGVDLILMTTHGRSGLRRAVFGSVADSVLRHAACPVLLVRITDRDTESATPT
jgi:nucleotide-binding universal stress UspA family protein